MKYILGINCSGFHSSACLVQNGDVVAAICEERLSRIKQDRAFPHLAIAYCCQAAGIAFEEIAHAFVGWHPRHYLRKSDRTLLDAMRARGKIGYLALNELATQFTSDLTDVSEQLQSDNSRLSIGFVDHHKAHLANAYYQSGFDDADFLILDGFGEVTTGICGQIGTEGVTVIHQYPAPHSLGSFYSTFTDFLGFKPDSDEWKVMALSALGDPAVYYDRIRPLATVDGLRFELDLSFFEHFIHFTPAFYARKLSEMLGAPLRPGDPLGQREYDIVAAMQRVSEESVFSILNTLHGKSGRDKLVVGGGFFMNSVCNGKIQRETPYRRIYVGGSPDDSGVSIGSALYGANVVLSCPGQRRERIQNSHGRTYSNEEIVSELQRRKIRYTRLENSALRGAQLVYEGKILAWFQGGSEFGQRALGNRSILGDPTRADMKGKVNAAVKYREAFRPFAPAILEERKTEVLECALDQTVYFMEKVMRIKDEWRQRVPAVTHYDGTGRPQTVTHESNPQFYRLIKEFEGICGVPLVLNTSFNINGMPLVETPGDALNCFYDCGLDALIMGDYLVEK